MLPLYGKTIFRARQLDVYTETDKLLIDPIMIGGCTDDQGCEELYDGDVVIPSYGVFKVKIYKFNKPRYIPMIIKGNITASFYIIIYHN